METKNYKVLVCGEERKYPAGTTYLKISEDFQEKFDHKIVLVRIINIDYRN